MHKRPGEATRRAALVTAPKIDSDTAGREGRPRPGARGDEGEGGRKPGRQQKSLTTKIRPRWNPSTNNKHS